MEKGRYLYGIIKENEKKSFGLCGINDGEEVYAMSHHDIACVVSNSAVQDYSSMLKEALGRFLVNHQTIIEKIMQEHTIIPMKFGTNVSNDDEVIEVLKRGYPQFKELLINMDGKIELDLACIWSDLNSIIKEIGEETKEIREFKAEIAKRPANSSFQDRIKIGMMLKDALDKRREKEQAHIIDFLMAKETIGPSRNLTSLQLLKHGFLKGTTCDFQKHQVQDDKMILNCAFLLEKSREPDFDAKLKELDKEYKQKLNFRCVGPLPPYSFATCQLKKVEYSQINEARRLLGLRDEFSLEEIKESYRKFAQKNHPDKHPENSELKEKFEKVTRAYKLLSSCCQGESISFPPTPRLRGTSEDKKKKDFIAVEIIRP